MPDREAVALVLDLVLAEELDRLVRGAVDADLRAAEQAEAVFEADQRAVVEPEQVARRDRRSRPSPSGRPKRCVTRNALL